MLIARWQPPCRRSRKLFLSFKHGTFSYFFHLFSVFSLDFVICACPLEIHNRGPSQDFVAQWHSVPCWEALSISGQYLEKFRASKNKRGEAAMLLSLAESLPQVLHASFWKYASRTTQMVDWTHIYRWHCDLS